MSRKRLAEASGLSTSYLSQVESGKRKPSPDELAAMAKELGLEPDDIMDS
jgi:transcriptional regulator with XRE-family HTH domain